MIKPISLILICAISLNAHALNVPKGGAYDQRIKYVDYNAANVIKLVAHFGYQINIVLQEGETVLPKGVFLGDAEAWQFATLSNHIFIKPKEEEGTTNMTVLTNRRAYSFVLSSHWAEGNSPSPTPNDMQFQVVINYPDDVAAKYAAEQALKAQNIALEAEKARLAEKMNEKETIKNWNYMKCGSESVSPDAAYDDGRFTYLTFKGNRDIPAIFIVNEDNSESLINRHVEGNNVIIQATAKKFVLRKGKSVACVFNKSYDAIGNDNSSGTTVPGITRTIKGE